jgi:hypothetical protein
VNEIFIQSFWLFDSLTLYLFFMCSCYIFACLAEIYLSYNGFTGTIPTEIGQCTKLEMILLNANSFKGTVPEEIVKIKSLISLEFFGNNELSGTLANGMKQLSNLQLLHIQGTKIACPTEDLCAIRKIYVCTNEEACCSCCFKCL